MDIYNNATETNTMTFDDTRDNTTAIEATIIEADARYWPNGDPMTEPVWHTGFSLCDCEHCTADDDDDDGSIAAALFAQPHFGG